MVHKIEVTAVTITVWPNFYSCAGVVATDILYYLFINNIGIKFFMILLNCSREIKKNKTFDENLNEQELKL